MFSAYVRSKMMELNKLDGEQLKAQCQAYLAEAAKDSRRLIWMAERAAEQTAALLEEQEQKLVHAERFFPNEVVNITSILKQYEEDFRFLQCLTIMLRNQYIENAASDMASFFGGSKNKKPIMKLEKQ